MFGGGRLHVDRTFFKTKIIGDVFYHHGDVRSHLRRLRDDDCIHIADPIALISYQVQHFAQQNAAVDVLELRISVGKVTPYVAEGGRTQQRISDGMQQHVRIGMPKQPFFKRDIHPAYDKPPAFYQLVYIKTLTYAHVRSLNNNSAINKSCG